MRTVAIINQKGGCGKTTTSINLAACLARLGQKTLLADMDPQGHCGVGLAVPEEQIERTIFDCLIEEEDGAPAKIVDIVWQIATNFDLAPSNIRLAAFEQIFAGRGGRDDRLRLALEPAKIHYQWCIIDCPPSVGLITFNALKACDEVIVPVETGFFSLHGLAKMMETLEVLRERCGRDILIRILPTLYDTRTKLAREVLSELRGKFKGYLMESTVNFNTKLKEAASFGQPITEYDSGSRGYKDFVNLARELMGNRPLDVEVTPTEKLSRPAELVQRAKQLTQLTNFQFGRPLVEPMPGINASSAPSTGAILLSEPIITTATDSHAVEQHLAGPNLVGEWHLPPTLVTSSRPVAPMPSITLTTSAGISTISAPALAAAPKTTEEKIEEFYGVKQIGAQVIFCARFDDAKTVLIAGDFNHWSPMSTPMICGARPGEWRTALPLKPGRYRYRLIVDGVWVTDPNNTYVEANQFGELNNVIEVG
ncbi:MAG TPA: AAA family ATPase [Tepidisphaeraceae bacterium]|nr:AAA family ATPase [Tepidisphaeraceae bacterium]